MEMVMITMMMMNMMMMAAETATATAKMAPVAAPRTPSTAREVDCQK